MSDYVHGYATPERERLLEQAEHWRERLIRDGTTLEPGTRLLEIGCGVGAVLAVLGQEYRGIHLAGSTSRRARSSSRAATSRARTSKPTSMWPMRSRCPSAMNRSTTSG